MCLQETHSTKEDEDLWNLQWGGGKVIYSHGTSNSCGTMVMIPKNTSLQIENVFNDESGRLNMVKIIYEGKSFPLVNIYAPNEDNAEFFKELICKISENVFDDLIILK